MESIYDKETSTIYLRARYYEPATGRFMSEDPIRSELNWYTYCMGNPITFKDPSGYLRESGYYDKNWSKTTKSKGTWYSDPDAAQFGKNSDTYKILVDLGNRWMAAGNNSAERNRVHKLADDARMLHTKSTPLKFGNDVVMNTLHQNLATALDERERIESINGSFVNTSTFIWLTEKHFKVKDEINWDYKWHQDWQVPEHYGNSIYGAYGGLPAVSPDAENTKNWREWIYFEGALIAADKFANMNWGYVGTHLGYGSGYSKWQLFNIFTTGGDDDIYIQIGVDLANNGR